MEIKISDHFTYRRLLRFVYPCIIMMIFTSVYGVVDGLFISNFVGKTPFAAVNLIMPFIMILSGMGFMVGTGGGALVAKTLGEGRTEDANRYFTQMVIFAGGLGVVLLIVGQLLLGPVATLMGATEELLPHCLLYGRIVLSFVPFFLIQSVFHSFMTTAQKPKLGLLITVAAGVTNMVLDALLVAILPLGIAGAAVATGLSQCVGGLCPLLYFSKKNTSLLRLTKTRLSPGPILRACWNGSSELMTNISSSLVGMLYNIQLMRYAGENGVAAYGVLMYVQFIFAAIFIGFSIGSSPVVGYHFGAKNTGELQNMRRKGLLFTLLGGGVLFGAAQLLAPTLASIFVGYDPGLCTMTVEAFRIYAFSFLLMGYNIFGSAFFTALNNGAVSAAVSFLRTLVFQLGCVLLLPTLFGLTGIWWSVFVAESFASLFITIFFIAMKKRYQY